MHPFFTAHALLAAFLLFPPNYAASAVSEPGWRPDYRPISLVEDAGCAVVTVKYDAEADRVLWVICNGEA